MTRPTVIAVVAAGWTLASCVLAAVYNLSRRNDNDRDWSKP